MEKISFNTTIDTTTEKVWSTLWDDASYREWTSAFTPGSWAKTDWQKGSKALFLNENNSGLVSEIADHIPNEFMSIRHLGIVKDGVEDVESAAVKAWQGAKENYTLTTAGDKTNLLVELDIKGLPGDMLDYFNKTWPVALEKLKAIAER